MPLGQLLKGCSGELQSEMQLILDAFVEGVCGVDSQGNATFCNDAVLRMTGYAADELVGKNLHDLLRGGSPDDAAHEEKNSHLRMALDQQRTLVERELICRKDGAWIPVQYCVCPFPAASSETTNLVTFHDVSERDQATRALRDSEDRFRRILSSVAEVAWTADEGRRIVYISPKVEAVLGYTKGEICAAGERLGSGLIHPEDFGRVNKSYRNLFEKQIPYDEEYRIRRKDGTWIWIHDRANHVHEENGVLYADGVFGDITRRKKAEAELHWKTAFLEAQANSTIDGILVVGSNGRTLMHNQRFVEMFRVSAELVAKQTTGSCWRICPRW